MNEVTRDYTMLYIGTCVMLAFALVLIFFIVWATSKVNSINRFTNERDKYYIERFSAIEAIIRTEFKAVFESLKKIT